MEWRTEGIVLKSSPYGEHDAIADLLTREYGRTRGFVKAGSSRKYRNTLQVGNRVDATWRARLEDSLGRLTVEPVSSPLGEILHDPFRLQALNALSATVLATLPEREAVPDLFDLFVSVLTVMRLGEEADIIAGFVRFDLMVLGVLGYGLDLSVCAVTGAADDLCYVSPRTGRAVSTEGASGYRDRLLVLPAFLIHGGSADLEEASTGLALSQYFMDRAFWSVARFGEPQARSRFRALIAEKGRTLRDD